MAQVFLAGAFVGAAAQAALMVAISLFIYNRFGKPRRRS